jgi:hypothetical protein
VTTHVNRAAIRTDEVNVSCEGLWLNLVHLRQLVECASDMSDDAEVFVKTEAAQIRGESYVTSITVRAESLILPVQTETTP